MKGQVRAEGVERSHVAAENIGEQWRMLGMKFYVTETVEFDIILYNMLVMVHLEVIDSVFSVSSGVYGTELSAESLDKVGPIIKPVRNFVRVKEGWLKEFQGSPSEIGKHKGHLVRVIRVDGIAAKKRLQRRMKLLSFWGLEPSKVSGSLALAFWIGGSQWRSCSVMSIIASAKLGARLLRVLACSGSLGSCSSCGGFSRDKVGSQGCSSC